MRIESFLRGTLAASLLALAGLAHSAATITIVNGNAAGVGFNDPDAGGAGGRQSWNDARPAAAERLHVRRLALGRPAHQQRRDPHPRDLRAAPLHGDRRGARPGRPALRRIRLPERAGARHLVPRGAGQQACGCRSAPAAADPAAAVPRSWRFSTRAWGCFPTACPACRSTWVSTATTAQRIDLVEVLLHEFAHGLGFSTTTDGSDGTYLAGQPSIYDHFAFDNTAAKTWVQMTNAERAASAINARQLVWIGANVTAAAPLVLVPGTPQLVVRAPSTVAGDVPGRGRVVRRTAAVAGSQPPGDAGRRERLPWAGVQPARRRERAGREEPHRVRGARHLHLRRQGGQRASGRRGGDDRGQQRPRLAAGRPGRHGPVDHDPGRADHARGRHQAALGDAPDAGEPQLGRGGGARHRPDAAVRRRHGPGA